MLRHGIYPVSQRVAKQFEHIEYEVWRNGNYCGYRDSYRAAVNFWNDLARQNADPDRLEQEETD